MGDEQTVRLALRVIPNASRNELSGWLGGALKVKIMAPAEGGRGNRALIAFLAKELGVPRRAVTLVSGEKARAKVIAVVGLSECEIRHRLAL